MFKVVLVHFLLLGFSLLPASCKDRKSDDLQSYGDATKLKLLDNIQEYKDNVKDPKTGADKTVSQYGRTLLHTFPFEKVDKRENIKEKQKGFGDFQVCISFQGPNLNKYFQSNSINNIPDLVAGQRCVQKVVMEERMEYDEVIECNHSYDKRCFTSLSTTFTPTQEGLSYNCK